MGDELKSKTYKPPPRAFNWDGNDALRQFGMASYTGEAGARGTRGIHGKRHRHFSVVAGDGMSIFYHNTKIGTFYGDHLQETTANA